MTPFPSPWFILHAYWRTQSSAESYANHVCAYALGKWDSWMRPGCLHSGIVYFPNSHRRPNLHILSFCSTQTTLHVQMMSLHPAACGLVFGFAPSLHTFPENCTRDSLPSRNLTSCEGEPQKTVRYCTREILTLNQKNLLSKSTHTNINFGMGSWNNLCFMGQNEGGRGTTKTWRSGGPE